MAKVILILLVASSWTVYGQIYDSKSIEEINVIPKPADISDVEQQNIERLMAASQILPISLTQDVINNNPKPCRRRYNLQNLPKKDFIRPIINPYTIEEVPINYGESKYAWLAQSLKNDLPAKDNIIEKDEKERETVVKPFNYTSHNSKIESKDCTMKSEDPAENLNPKHIFTPNLTVYSSQLDSDPIKEEPCDDKKEIAIEIREHSTRRFLNSDDYNVMSKFPTRQQNNQIDNRRQEDGLFAKDVLLYRNNLHKKNGKRTNENQADVIAGGLPLSSDLQRKYSQNDQIVCYACSTLNNPRCWKPDRHTTVKYCKRGHDVCVIKTYEFQDTEIILRDCAPSCSDTSIPGLPSKPKLCAVCRTDLCNGAYAVNSHKLLLTLCFLSVMNYICG